jgi:hypothetical protein
MITEIPVIFSSGGAMLAGRIVRSTSSRRICPRKERTEPLLKEMAGSRRREDEMDDRMDIAGVIGSLAVHVDGRHWDDLLALFAPQIRVDYTSLFGGDAQSMAREDLIGAGASFSPASRGRATSLARRPYRRAVRRPGQRRPSLHGTS